MIKICRLLIIASAALVFIGCGASSMLSPTRNGTGDMDMALSLTVDNVASGTVTVTKDSETRTKAVSISGEQGIVKFFDMTPGTWVIDVRLYNSIGELLYSGSGSGEVIAGQTSVVSISMIPQEGNIRIIFSMPATPLLWNTLDDGYALTASDIGPAVSCIGTPVYAAAKFETGVAVGATSYLTATAWPLGTKEYGADAYSIEFWFAHTGASYDTGIIASVEDGPAVTRAGDAGNPLLRLSLPTGSIEQTIPADNAFHHYAVTVSTTECRLYIDGILTHTLSSLPAGAQSGAVRLSDAADSVEGVFDNLKVYTKARSDFSDRFIE